MMARLLTLVCGLVAVFLAFPADTDAQFKGRTPPARQMPDRLTQEDGEALLEQFRQGQNVGTFAYRFELEERPYREASWTTEGVLYASWIGDPFWTRIEIDIPDGGHATWLLRNGTRQEIWYWDEACEAFVALDRENWAQPLIPGSSIRAFDLLMPFVYWENFDYLGSTRHLGRPVQRFMLENPDPDTSPQAVEVYLDETYLALLQVRSYDDDGDELRRWEARSFRRAGDDWTLGRLDLSDRIERGRTRLQFSHYMEYPNLDTCMFRPESSLPRIERDPKDWQGL